MEIVIKLSEKDLQKLIQDKGLSKMITPVFLENIAYDFCFESAKDDVWQALSYVLNNINEFTKMEG